MNSAMRIPNNIVLFQENSITKFNLKETILELSSNVPNEIKFEESLKLCATPLRDKPCFARA